MLKTSKDTSRNALRITGGSYNNYGVARQFPVMTEFQYALLKSTSYGWLCGKELSFKAEIDGVADVND